MVTHTPIPYWLSRPWGEVWAWSSDLVDIQEQDRAALARAGDR